MQYILIDNFNGNINIITDSDFMGTPLVFNNLSEAEEALIEHCHNGQIVPLGIDIIDLLKNIELFSTSFDASCIMRNIRQIVNK